MAGAYIVDFILTLIGGGFLVAGSAMMAPKRITVLATIAAMVVGSLFGGAGLLAIRAAAVYSYVQAQQEE
jgi:hypothetical protein